MKIGLVVNPIAGMGGAVGLKGTDGPQIIEEAGRRGAVKSSPARASEALESVKSRGLDIEWLSCGGEMGEKELVGLGFTSTIVHDPSKDTSADDTKKAVRKFIEHGASLIVFAGGDGTARDVFEVAEMRVPILGIPTGVKMQSSVFLNSLGQLGDALMTFVSSCVTKEGEIMDVNEDAFRNGVVEAKLYGVALVPDDVPHIQPGKMSYHSGTADDEAEEIGQYMADSMAQDTIYILGPGSTTAAIARIIGQEKTLLGADAYLDKKRIVADGSEKALLEVHSRGHEARIVVSPIGAQGFIFGRGNQQISARVIRRVGVSNITVVATPTKLAGTKVLRVDTGDGALDQELRGKIKVVTGYKRRKLVRVA